MRIRYLTAVLAGLTLASSSRADDLKPIMEPILGVSREGGGNRNAAQAWRQLVAEGTPAILPILGAMDGADPTASNWLRTAVDAIAGKAEELPAKQLRKFLQEDGHSPDSRRLAFELVVKAKPKSRDALLAGMLNDPSLENRRDAIGLAMSEAKTAEEKKRLFDAARDKDQIDELAKALDKLGTEVSVTEHFNFITKWHVIGPFDSNEGKGFAKKYPPEEGVELDATYSGKADVKLKWVEAETTDKYGELDLNKAIGPFKFAAAYAFAAVDLPKARQAEIRVASNNAVKIFLNGTEVLAKEEYHHGYRFDQYVAPVKLAAGRNEILLKICQNNQTENWAQKWSFQCRVCDRTGGKIPMTVVAEK